MISTCVDVVACLPRARASGRSMTIAAIMASVKKRTAASLSSMGYRARPGAEGAKKMRNILASLSLVSAFCISCAGSAPDNCAFRAQDGSCAVTASSSGALECQLDDSALCQTVTAFVANRKQGEGVATSALINTG